MVFEFSKVRGLDKFFGGLLGPGGTLISHK